MAKPFDATLKDLVREAPAEWAAGLDSPGARRAKVLTPDLSTLTAFADLVLRVNRHLLHLEFQSGPDASLARRVLFYNALLHHRYGLPVHSVVVLLRPRADRADVTGRLRYEVHSGRGGMDFRFEVVRLWERPAEALLAAPPGMVPLAVLGRLPGADTAAALAEVVRRMHERLTHVAPKRAPQLLTAAYILAGMVVPKPVVNDLFQGIPAMMESSTYRGLINDGRLEGAKAILLRLGRIKFGEPDEATEATLRNIKRLKRLEALSERLLRVNSWEELLANR
jgi:hypothetical protein